MEIEQTSPNQPKFILVVGLFCATLLVVFVLALFFLHFDFKHLTFRHHDQHPVAKRVVPAPDDASVATQRA